MTGLACAVPVQDWRYGSLAAHGGYDQDKHLVGKWVSLEIIRTSSWAKAPKLIVCYGAAEAAPLQSEIN